MNMEFNEENDFTKIQSVKIEYKLSQDDIIKAFMFIGKQNSKKRITTTLVYSAAIIYFLWDYFANTKAFFQLVVVFLCAAAIIYTWVALPIRAKSVAKEIAAQDKNLSIIFSEENIAVGSGDELTTINYTSSIKLTQLDEMYILSDSKDRMFAIPKRFISEQNKQRLDELIKLKF